MIPHEITFQLAELQKSLLECFEAAYPVLEKSPWLIGVPSTGEVKVENERWKFAKHGSGMIFSRLLPEPSLVVDIHSHFWDFGVLDAWRLQQFAESLGSVATYDDAKVVLVRAVEEGKLKRDVDGDHFRTL